MTDYERHAPTLFSNPEKDRGTMVRTIIQSLILTGIVGLVSMVIQQGKDSSKADSDRSVQIATLQSQVSNLQTLILGMPDLSQRVTRLEANQQELIRRQNGDDVRWEQMNNPKMKGWTR